MSEPFPAATSSPASPVARHSLWTSVRVGRQDARLRLYCFPFVGATAAVYLPLAKFLPDSVEMCSLEVPGRGPRCGEPPTRSVPKLVQALSRVVADDASGRPFAFFGHCSGGLLAYETACALAAARQPGPDLLAVSAMGPPHAYARRVKDAFRHPTTLMSLAAAMVSDAQLRSAAVEAVSRAELLNYLAHTPLPAPPLRCRVTIAGGEKDPIFPPALLNGWSAHTTAGTPPLRLYPGGHMFLMDHWPHIARDLTEDLASVTRGAQ